ncbi:filamentous hemagglutinin family protein [Luteibacter rhizovicinus]|uniref:Filamentous hemagglutinin family protein n=1 Tax=Luteibacter rhizovicinus TaxID=242606 RepID=A0A4R3YJD9_9GAMM|nr:YDG domain-containing protein [Luteibacter rhizovicinus]TCV92330.1 filamentous hemagglutinin family protein [Luteibacter rhizovicinus]
MNRIYRLCWNISTNQWVAASELARGARPGASRVVDRSGGPRLAKTLLAAALALGSSGQVLADQTGGQIVAGTGSIVHNGATTTISQASQHLSLNWQSFDIAANETVNFVQPGANSIAVNRILGNSASEIYGHLNANGQVWLINPNGVLFGKGAQVNVGGLVASTLDTADASMSSNKRSFSGDGKGSVVNLGSINVAPGGYVALLGNRVSNQGTISARMGSVAMGAGSAVTLTFDANQLVSIQVDKSTLDNLAENRQLIQADGGRVFMTAGAADSLLTSTVNNTGVIRAQTVENRDGSITLLGGMTAGTTNVGGTLDASAPTGGNGGAIETSAAYVNIGGGAKITAAAPHGKAGTWLIDPYDLTIDAAAASTISTTLNGGTNVTETTTASGASGAGVQNPTGSGDIIVNSAINWSNAAATLTLDAFNGIAVNAAINGAGGVVMNAGAGNISLAGGGTIAGGTGVSLTAKGNFINNAGANALTSASGRWLVYSTNPTASTTGGLAPNFIQYNAAAGATPAASGNGFLYSVAPTVTVTGLTGSVRKTYDGTTVATLAGANINSTGLINSDKIATATGSYASANAATGIAVTVPSSGANLTFTNAGGIPVYGYQVAGLPRSASIGIIDPKALTVAIVGNPTKTYDGSTTATLSASNYLLVGLVTGENVTFSQPSSVAYAAADAGAESVSAAFLPSNFVAGNGTRLANYTLPSQATGMGTINKAQVQLTGLLGTDKVYDGSTADALDKSKVNIYGVIAPDASNVTLDTSGGAGTFADANVGTGKSVTASGFVLTGSQAHNYDLIMPIDLTGSITPKALTIANVSALNKVYDAKTLASLVFGGASLNGLVAADQGNIALDTSGAAGNFATTHAGNGIGVTATGFSLVGAGTGNYTLTQPAGLTANITPAALAITITGNPSRTYNGTNNANIANGDVTITGFQGSDGGTVTQSAGATYDGKDAGSHTITALLEASVFSLTGATQLSDYSFPLSVTGLGTITPITLTYALIGNPTRNYDGTTVANLTNANFQLNGFLAGEGATVTKTTGAYANQNAGQWLVTANLGAGDFNPTGGTVLGNYVFPTVMTGMGTIVPAPLAAKEIYAELLGITRAYDGTTVANLTASNFNLIGFVNGDGATVTKTTGTFADKNVGKQAVSASLAPSDFVATGSTILSNYTLPTAAYGTGEITPALLTASIIGNPTKVYDGSRYISLVPGNFSLQGFASGEGADIQPPSSSLFDDKNAGNGKGITATMAASSYIAHSGTLLSNYTLATDATGTGTINKAPLSIVGVSAQNKVYDTTNAATLSGTGSLVGLVAADESKVTLISGTTGTFSQVNVGNGLSVAANGFSISGSEVGNYVLAPITGLTANITQAQLHIGNVTANDKDYDSTNAITLTTGGATLTGLLGSDAAVVSLDATNAQGTTRSPNAADGLAVTTTGFSLTGTGAGNYAINQAAGLTANIRKKQLTATIIGDPTKPYDGSNSVTLTDANYQLGGFVGSQSAKVPQSATASYKTVDAGSNIGLESTLVVSDFVAGSGTNLSNYLLPTTASGTGGTITQAILNLQGTRVYDATTNAAAALFLDGSNRIAGVNGEYLTLSGTGTLTTKNVGSQRSFVDTNGLALGNGTGNATNYTLVGGIDWVTITPATLTVTGTLADNKTYDGNTGATIHGSVLQGGFAGDDLTLGGTTTGTFDTKNAGTNKSVATNLSVTGVDTGNYILEQPTDVKANIDAKTIAVNATGINKVYDTTTAATVTLGSGGVVGGDQVTFAGTSRFDTKDVGNGKAVSVSGITSAGADAGNYVLSSNAAATTASITPYLLDLLGTRVYDTTTNADAALFTVHGAGSETGSISGIGTLADKNVGNNKAAAVGSLVLGDNGAFLASNYQIRSVKVTVTQAELYIINTVAANKTYDGNTIATLSNALLTGVLAGDAVGLGNFATGTFDSKNVGTGKSVSTNMTVSGSDSTNYHLNQPANVKADIFARGITVVADGVNRVYDATTASGATLKSLDVVTTDNVVFTNTSNLFDTKDVGNGKLVTVSGIGMTGADANNYTLLNNQTTTSANITPYLINLHGERDYDGSNVGAGSLFGTINGVAGETLTVSGSGLLANKNVGTQKPVTSLDSLQLVGDGATLGGNYTLVGGIHWVTVDPLHVTVVAAANDKVYDGSTGATSALSSGGILAGDTVSFAGSSAFGDKNVDNGKTVTVTGIAASGADAGNYLYNVTTTTTANITPLAITGAILANDKVYDALTGAVTHGTLTGQIAGDVLNFDTTGAFGDKNVALGKTVNVAGSLSGIDARNYTLTTNATTTAAITPLAINVTATAPNKVYDGTTGSTATLGSAGVIAGDTVNFAQGTADFDTKNVGTNKTVTVTGIAGSGTDAGNYTWNTSTTTHADITPLAIIGSIVAANKVYDTTIGAITSGTLAGVIAGDQLSFATSGNFSDKNVANGKTVNVSGSVSGADAGNYVLTTNATAAADITPLAILVTAIGTDKVYDANTHDVATVAGHGVLAGDTVAFAGGPANFSDKNVGNGKTVTVTGITASGTDAGNYSYNGTALTTANITPLAISGAITAADKTYDGTTSTGIAGTLTGVLAGDNIGFATTGAFADKNAGTGKTVNVAGALNGTDANNYTLTTNATTLADINRLVLNLAGTRVYDATAIGGAAMFGSSGVIAGIAGEALTLSGQGVLASKNVATGKPLAGLGSLALNDNGGALASNYTLIGGTHIATVTPLAVNGAIVAGNKVYDGNTSASTSGSLNGVLGGDDLSLATSGRFGDKNAGNGKTVNVAGTLGGGDAGNYVLIVNPTTTADITRRQVTVNATGVDKFFDGNARDPAKLASTGVLGGDVVSFGANSALFANATVGNGKAVSVSGIYATGADAANYAFNDTAATTASILPLASQGESANALTQIDSVLGPSSIETPFGAAAQNTIGQYTGNHKKTRQSIEENLGRKDFYSGLSLRVVNGGVSPATDAIQ